MLKVIPFQDGATYSFEKYYRRSLQQIGQAAGPDIEFFRTGDPKFSDEQTKAKRTHDQVKEDRRLSAQWKRKYSTTEAQEHQRISQSLEWFERFNLKLDDFPCFVFITPEAKRVGLLRIDHRWYESGPSWRIFHRSFCAWLELKDVREMATKNLGNDVISARLSLLLNDFTSMVNQQLLSPRVNKRTAVRKTVSADVYCHVLSEKRIETMTRGQYDRLVGKMSDYDMFIDGITRHVSSRDPKGKTQYSKLTPRELDILLHYINHDGSFRPRDTPAGIMSSGLDAANHLLESARRKVDPAIKRYEYRFFHTIRHPLGTAYREYRFAPLSKLKYRIIQSL